MTSPKASAEDRMEKLSATVKRGWAKRHPLSAELRTAIQDKVRSQSTGPELRRDAALRETQENRPTRIHQRPAKKSKDDDFGRSR